MKNLKKKLVILASMIFITGISFTYASFKDVISNPGDIAGNVGIRSYFDSGAGTSANPFIITRPIHLDNLSKLNSLGVFGTTKYYFEIGKKIIDGDDNYYVYTSDSSTTTTQVLDMTGVDFTSIGSHVNPFFGEIDGHNIVVDNLSVISEPEDVGFFGYTASGSVVKNIMLKEPSISNNGYNSSLSGLFGGTFVDTLKYGTDGTTITTPASAITSSTTSDLTKNFILTATAVTGYNFSLSSSNNYLTKVSATELSIDTDTLSSLHGFALKSGDSTDYNDTSVVIKNRIYVVSSTNVTYDSLTYKQSRVIDSYTVSYFYTPSASPSTTAGTITFNVSKDSTTNTLINPYNHGFNIGFLIGHADGSCYDNYVYNGELHVNNNSSYTSSKNESDFGLIGEVGAHNDTSSYASGEGNDTGVLYFDNMFNSIRKIDQDDRQMSTTVDSTTYTYYRATNSQGNYDMYYHDNIFDSYVLKDNGDNGTTGDSDDIASALYKRSVDLKNNKYIVGTDDNGLGVFNIATHYSANTNFYNQLGQTEIRLWNPNDMGGTKSRFYYTTAEFYDPTQTCAAITETFANTYNDALGTRWEPTNPSSLDRQNATYTANEEYPTLITDSRSTNNYTTVDTTNPGNNYIFEAELNNSRSTGEYFFSTDSGNNCNYLKSYFANRLVGSDGNALSFGDDGFGVKCSYYDANGDETNVTSISRYMKLSSYGSSAKFGTDSSTYFYEDGNTTDKIMASTINFTLNKTCNVTIFATSNEVSNDGGRYIGIYNYDLSLANGGKYSKNPMYAMFIPRSGTMHFLDYTGNNSSGNPSGLIFAHTFKIPAGRYFIKPCDFTAQIVYLCVQGQTEGQIGTPSYSSLPIEYIKNINFLIYDPTSTDFVLSTSKSKKYFIAYFPANNSYITVSVSSSEVVFTASTTDITLTEKSSV